MFVRAKTRFKDGKERRYWSVVENRRNRDGRVVQRQLVEPGSAGRAAVPGGSRSAMWRRASAREANP